MKAPDKIYLQVCGECLEEDCKNCKFEDLEKEIEKAQEHYFALKDKGFSLDSMDVSVLARHFYELGRKVRKEE